ncbi:SDR family NAD(P)-dependent oxidoreductase [Chitinophaga sancti]|uniref:SDR family NAD(P)-dependent oxidoreductase n=1 Tax=Chitinophaga sancti TaxID=1004 RepID=UPI002A748431|nr:SDR family NAD(P)-dependent oxidoreductase [Chitinophaga sancti]WPQ61781.1 SDR family NAD(P)-dependent oxidoreductase [Chitinophaga sancti]
MKRQEISDYTGSLLLLQSYWKTIENADDIAAAHDKQLILFCEGEELCCSAVEAELEGAECRTLRSTALQMASQYEDYVITVFNEVRQILQEKSNSKVLLQIVLRNDATTAVVSGLSGLLKTAQLENPRLKGQVITVASADVPVVIATKIRQAMSLEANEIRFEGNRPQVLSWDNLVVNDKRTIPWKKGGVYLITGGMGGLGLIVAKEILEAGTNAKVVLTGRSHPDADKQQQLSALELLGEVVYIQSDITSRTDTELLIEKISKIYGGLTGILHVAGVNRDNFIIKKSVAEFQEVMSAKVRGLVHLDEATAAMPLDFIVLFSSISGLLGNIGQADYATANAFMDRYAVYRNHLVREGIRKGRTITVNWPLWEQGGMQMDPHSIQFLQETTGIIPLKNATGIEALYRVLTAASEQVMVLEGDVIAIRKQFISTIMKSHIGQVEIPGETIDQALLREKTLSQLTALFAEVGKLDQDIIDARAPLEHYGIDSLMINQLNKKLATIFSELSKTLFFEYNSLQLLSEYLVTAYSHQCIIWTGLNNKNDRVQPAPANDQREEKNFSVLTSFAKKKAKNVVREKEQLKEQIAIIGLSGRYPGAADMKAYWENLKSGKDCITEIPKDRWSLDGFFNENKQDAALTNMSYSKWGGFLEGYADFDPLFFNISPKEAMNIDPQERLFIQSCWNVLEDAGYTREQLETMYQSNVGVFAGVTKTGYDLYGPDQWRAGNIVFPHTSFGSVANRVSYLLGFKGPSMPVDTMCSSSLTAIHEACRHILDNECEIAIAGAVNLYLHPACYVALCSQQMLSVDGKCKSFGNNGNGFVPGEGVGAVLLKRLSKAEADGDHIYGIIKGSAINHGGKTNGYTVPSPVAQGQLIRSAIERAGINARTISYIEAHGTGTALGDPIEVTGLEQAFRKDTGENQFCMLGAAKSNIGHLEAAAGIAGLSKVLLQMKAKQIAPSLHAAVLNPDINFSKTPFVVAQELTSWERPVIEIDGITREYPRIAGISSFGAGGSNAHVIIEEYIDTTDASTFQINNRQAGVFILSAKNEQRLKERAAQLLTLLKDNREYDTRLSEIAYTLQVGRDAMDERLGIIAVSAEDLVQKLSGYLSGAKGLADVFTGQVKRGKASFNGYAGDEDMAATISAWVAKMKYDKLLDLWVKGFVFDWTRLYDGALPRRISLPAYPFSRERYWIPANNTLPVTGTQSTLHPLVHRNTSTLSEQRFSSFFTGNEFFLADHLVQGHRMLPGVAYLEMAREAVVQALGAEDAVGVRLRNVVWSRPVMAGPGGKEVHISVFEEDNGQIGYEIHSEDEAGEPVIHSQGTVVAGLPETPPVLDIEGLRIACDQGLLSSAVCYESFRQVGLNYGPGHQTIKEIYVGDQMVLAKLRSTGTAPYTLHPGMLDGALQSSIGLIMEGTAIPAKPMLPFALQEVAVYGPCSSDMWALIRYSEGSGAADKIQKLDITVCDETGKVCVALKGYSSRVFDREGVQAAAAAGPGRLLLVPEWKAAVAPAADTSVALAADTAAALHQVIVCHTADNDFTDLSSYLPGVACSLLSIPSAGAAEGFTGMAITVFTHIQKLLKTTSTKDPILVQLAVCGEGAAALFQALSGLLKTARQEYPLLKEQLIAVPTAVPVATLAAQLKESMYLPAHDIRFISNQAEVMSWKELSARDNAMAPWKEGGVYLITGGMGGVGLLFAKEILSVCKDVKIVLNGRSVLGREKQQELESLQSQGTVTYIPADISDRAACEQLMDNIRSLYGGLTGILHGAGVLRDSFIIKKTAAELSEVLSAKVSGLVNLDVCSRAMELDLFVLFSSVSGVLGNAGQADYAMGNAFMDRYAVYRNELAGKGICSGRMVSVNWPLWKEGGMQLSAATIQLQTETTGMQPLQTSTGIRTLYEILAGDHDQVVVLEGNIRKIKEKVMPVFLGTTSPKKQPVPVVTEALIKAGLQQEVKKILIQLVSVLLKVDEENIEGNAELSEYGFDSISFTQLANRLNHEYDLGITPAVFFEYSTLDELSAYLEKEHTTVFAAKLVVQDERVDIVDEVAATKEPTSFQTGKRKQYFVSRHPEPPARKEGPEPLAIIGISGRFPMADNVQELWENLYKGKDCIGEIPLGRWDWKEYYGNPLNESNKTNIKWGGFIEGMEEFDPLFFGISPREAEFMDPQQRLLMMYVWKAIEDAGYAAQSLSGSKTGIFVATACSGYNTMISQANIPIEGYSSTGMAPSVGPNRMSYFLNFHGPSEPIETACSSSLIAIHRAMEAINAGSCDMAVVGGINTILTPEAHISFNKAGMLCEDGRCKTFSSKANGYVRSEAVGMIFLKRLSAAEKDNDHIYGIIRSTAENHGGRANSLTAPNPKAQMELLKAVYTKAGISPDTVSYIEAHGTGTELGDPIEINALKGAFKELYQAAGINDKAVPHCGLGSIKTNIGHTELAAGISGVMKVILQLQHKTLVKTLHCDTINPFIQLQDTPFYVVQENRVWNRLVDARGKEIPRRAGVSSFGFGGSNAHVVIEEYIGATDTSTFQINNRQAGVFILSAKNEQRLKERAAQLLALLKDNREYDTRLSEIAYTLQVGRDAMDERLGIIAVSAEDLVQKLSGYLSGAKGLADVFTGQVKRGKASFNDYAGDEDMAATISAWVAKMKYDKLLDLWVKGFVFDWTRLYDGALPRRINLPAYPFSRERYWIPANNTLPVTGTQSTLHPLVHRNTSTLSEQRFSSFFTGNEFFLADHLVQGHRMLPGVAYLEMAREAVVQALGAEDAVGVRLENVVWLRPVMAGPGGKEVHISVFEEDNGQIGYEIHSEDEAGEPVIHSQGTVVAGLPETPPVLDIEGLRIACDQGLLSSAVCYESFRQVGLNYGPGHQTIKEIYVGDQMVLAKLRSTGTAPYTLHPGMLDGALQSSIGLIMEGTAIPAKPMLPFALQEVAVYGPCSSDMWALIRYSEGSGAADKIQKLDITVCDETGKVCVALKGYSSRVFDREGVQAAAGPGRLLLVPEWKAAVAPVADTAVAPAADTAVAPAADTSVAPVADTSVAPAADTAAALHQVIVCHTADNDFTDLSSYLPGVACTLLSIPSAGAAEGFTGMATTVFTQIQKLLKTTSTKDPILVQLAVCGEGATALFQALSGLLKTARQEYPLLKEQLIAVPTAVPVATLAAQLKESMYLPAHDIRFISNQAEVMSWKELSARDNAMAPWKEGGVYLITGGMGGVGLLFAKEILSVCKDVKIVLNGRSVLGREKQQELESLQSQGTVTYIPADISDRAACEQLMNTIRSLYGGLTGILHGAGVLRDSFIIKKTAAELSEVLSAKVSGLVNLDVCSRAMKLDLFVLFSSVSGVLGNAGQADYAMGNAFMDRYAVYRNELAGKGICSGRTVSVNWPLWKEGGMQLSAATIQLQTEKTGMQPLQTSTGIRTLYEILAGDHDQVVVLEGDVTRIMSTFTRAMIVAVAPGQSLPDNVSTEKRQQKILSFLVNEVAELLKVPITEIDTDAEFLEYGLERVLIGTVVDQLQAVLHIEVSAKTFFEYRSIREAAISLSNMQQEKIQPRETTNVQQEKIPLHETTVPLTTAKPDTEKAILYFKKLLSAILKLSVHEMDEHAPMEKYGIDSFMVLKLTGELEKVFGPLSRTLFFEYQTIEAIAGYFKEQYPDQLQGLTGAKERPVAIVANEEMNVATAPEVIKRKQRRLGAPVNYTAKEKETEETDIAIVGLAGRYPQAVDIVAFWNNLKTGKDCITEIPKDRWDHSLYYDADKNKPGKTYSKWGGFIEGVDQFDPLFFNISPREAEIMDPQERIFLECVMATLEDAGYTRETLAANRNNGLEGNVGVFVGVMYEEYQLYGAQETIQGRPLAIPGNPSSVANRVSYYCNFHGPSLAVDTMCSSSLTAIHLACQSIIRGDCEAAVAGGVNVSVHPNKYLMLGQGRFVSSIGRCESFGEGGDGYVPGEGVGAVLLKPLSKAIADGDHIYGVIKGSAVNHGGKTNGYSVPNPGAQSGVISHAFKKSGVDPRSISYIEAHGTGTFLGDPIEIAGLNKAFREFTSDKQFCAIGSAKSNIGHCESAAGIAGLTKILLQLKHRQLVPSLHSAVLNVNIDFGNSPFVVQQELSPWERPLLEKNGRMEECPLRAGISSFGAGGSNAHLVIEEYRVTPSSPASTAGPYMLVLSARTGERLKAYAERLLHYFTSPSGESLQDIAYTLQTGREDMEERMGMLVHTREEATDKLQRYIAGEEDIEDLYTGQLKKDKESLWLLTDEDFHQGVVSWIRKGKYGKLLELWTKGYHLDWHLLYPSGMAKKVSLPTYPFARERYWFSKKGTTVAAPVIAATGEPRFLTKSWQPLSVRSQRARKGRIQILVTAATRSLGAAVAAQLVNSDVIGIEDIGRWDATSEGLIDLTGCEAQEMRGLHWLPVIQQYIEEKSREGIRLLGVTFDLERYGNKKVQVSGALHGGLYRMLGAEYRQVSSCHLDVLSEVPVSVVAEQIAAAYLFAGGHTEISVREGQYYTSVLTEQTLKSKAEKSIVFGENEVLWITGGTRGIGYLCAEHFVRHYGVRRLVLSGREVLPAREEWARVIAANGAQASKLKGIQHLESLGATVEILTVDITDAAAVSAQVMAVKSRHGRIGGVIHAAGIIDAETPAFIRKTQAGINAVLSAKVKGLEVLYGCLREEPLQFFVMYSSVSSQIPVLGAGQSDYTMGNAYMDYFAQGHQEGFPVLSIQWPSWKETGMGEIKNNVYAQTGLLSLSNDAGLSLLDDILADGSHPVIMPAIVNVSQWSPGSLLEVATVKPQIREAAATAVAVKNTTVVKTDQITPTIDWLTELFTRELKIEKSRFEISRSFPDYGVDSVLLSQILGQINKQLGEQLDPSVLMEYSSVEELSRWLEKKYSASLSALLTTPEPVAMEQLAEAPVESLPAAVSVASMQPLQELAEAPVVSLPAAVSVASVQPLQEEAIAVVGLSCRFPGADNLAAYWRLLSEGRSAISGVPYERWGYKSDHVAGLIDKMGYFDGAYFMISPEDARAMDPQALLLLEESLFAWHHAGYTLADIKGKPIGVYIGGRSQHRPSDELLQEAKNPIMAVGPNYLATNISRFFDLRGPALVVDTACSSALVGMNLAVQALQSGEIEAALVGGVGLLDTDNAHRIFAQRNLLSSDGHFHIFDQRAGGVVLGEGAGTVILKRVSQAVKDGDEIYAVIKGIAINNDGRTAGPATPNMQAQKEVMSRALLRSGIAASDISYIEANGSGSEVTDLLELKAISAVYGGTAACGLGSIKPNIGHPLCAEGIAGFIKVVLMLMHQQQAPFLSGQQGLAHYDLSATPFYFNRELQDWKGNIAALNCFADGGTNAHVIIAAADEQLLTGHAKRRTPLPVPILRRYNMRSGLQGNQPAISGHNHSGLHHKNNTAGKKNKFWKQII